MFLGVILHFDFAALFIFAITIFYVIYRKSYKAYSSFLFLLINILYFVVCVIDILVSSNILPIIPEKIGMFLYYFLKYQASIVYLLYIIVITNSADTIKNKRNGIIFSIPFVITIAFLISNIFTGHIYYFDGNVYHRGDYIFIFYGLSFIYVIIGLLWLIRFIKAFKFNELFALFSVYVLSVAALITQFFKPDALIELLASSISFILLSVTIERSQIIVDPRTGLKNFANFKKTMFITFKRKKEIGLIIFYVKNYSVLYEKFSYDVALKRIRAMTTYMSKAFLSEVSYECYYLGDGVVAITTSSVWEAEKLAQIMNDTMLNPDYDKVVFNVNYLLCISSFPSDFNSLETFYKFITDFPYLVDYERKAIHISTLKNDDKLSVLFGLDKIINRTIENGNISIEFQPAFDVKEKKYNVLEALARVYDEKYGIINADKFISYAESKDKIYSIDMMVIEKVYESYTNLNLKSLGVKSIAVNISVKTIINSNFFKDLNKLEDKYKLGKEVVVFEVRERGRKEFIPQAFETINNMMKDGYLFSLDNFGIGCMPVGNLSKAPYVYVKFDLSFAKTISKKSTYKVVRKTIDLFRNLNKCSVCTGVENEREAKIIETLKPDYVQGYYYSEPLNMRDLVKFLVNNNK